MKYVREMEKSMYVQRKNVFIRHEEKGPRKRERERERLTEGERDK
jgi:hypothetical protein